MVKLTNMICVIDHWHDVLVGSILGLVTSYFSYRQFYPSLSSARSHHPFSPRVNRETEQLSVLPTHHQRPSREAMMDDHSADGMEMATQTSGTPVDDGRPLNGRGTAEEWGTRAKSDS